MSSSTTLGSRRHLRPAADSPATAGWGMPARIAALGIAGFLIASVIAGSLSTGYGPAREAISALAATDAQHPVIMITGFVLGAIGLGAAAVGIWQRHRATLAGRVATVMIMLGAPGMIVAGFARQDCSERLPSCLDYDKAELATTHFWVHQYVSLAMFVIMSIAMFVLARALWRNVPWRHLTGWSILAGLLCFGTIALLMVDPPAVAPYMGYLQRIFIVILFGWPVLVAGLAGRNRVRAVADHSTPTVPSALRDYPRPQR